MSFSSDAQYAIAQNIFGHAGRMLSGSKSFYAAANPKNVIVFNGNICTQSGGKIWYGDIDITKDEAGLKALAAAIGEDVYVLFEMDGRFDNEHAPKLDKARAIISSTEIKIQGRN